MSADRTLIGALDQGTSSTRFLIFDACTTEVVTYFQVEVTQLFPKEGWCEEDPLEILQTAQTCMEGAVKNLEEMNISKNYVKAIGITNQRETTVVWDKRTGKPLHNAIVWLDARTAVTVDTLVQKTATKDKNQWLHQCGLPITTYFSAVKLRWLLDNCPEVKKAAEEDRCLFGTVDTWLIWNLSGGLEGGKFVTDVTNASRTMLMNIHTLQWDPELLQFFQVSLAMLPEIKSSSEIFANISSGSLQGLPIAGVLGDQQAAMVGQSCFSKGEAKNTYGTGCFLLYNTGEDAVFSDNGLLTTVGYQLGPTAKPKYALEGSIAIAGACVSWLKDNLNFIQTSAEIEALAASVDSVGDCYFVPAFTGLFCPYWMSSARGTICGLTQSTTKGHIARACLEAVCFQTREVLDAMNRDSKIPLKKLQVDGGMTANKLLMQVQADIIGIPVVRPVMSETTALGAAMAAGNAVGVWNLEKQDGSIVSTDTFLPAISPQDREFRYGRWLEAVNRSMNWDTSTKKTDSTEVKEN